MTNCRLSIVAVIGLLVLAQFFSLIGATKAVAATEIVSESVKPTENGDSKEKEEAKPVPRHFDLGAFEIRQLRPTRNETIDVNFELYLVLSKEADEAVKKKLEFWKHRLREQVLTSVRLTETKFFSEPDLLRLQRVILLRINRICPEMHIAGIYITRFIFGAK
jgi:hypothetical protein